MKLLTALECLMTSILDPQTQELIPREEDVLVREASWTTLSSMKMTKALGE